MVPRWYVVLVASALLPEVAPAQHLSQRVEALFRRGTTAEFQALSRELARDFRVEAPGLRQTMTNSVPCAFTIVASRSGAGGAHETIVTGDAETLSPRIEVVRNDTTALTGLRLVTRDAMPVLRGARDGGRSQELTAVTVWIGADPTAAVVASRRALLARYVDRCHRYF
jgi:hypothetical protein